jgi:DNA-binding NarL/FixJ family response regulator
MLTTREIDVLELLAQGCSYAAIGERLGISAHTVASHIKNGYRKLGVHCAAAAVMRAVELELIGPRSARVPRSSVSDGSSEVIVYAA